MKSLLTVLAVAVVLQGAAVDAASKPGFNFRGMEESRGTIFQKDGYPGAMNCTTHWFTQYIDHFSFGTPSGTTDMTYQQRYLTFDKYYKPGGPIFFYAGNEGPITIFADIAGLMWQNAEKFNAALVFAEHRFFGQSQPCNGTRACFGHLSTMQAMADYAILLTELKKSTYNTSVGVIAFGGSYGGMLSGYMRIKYPNIITGSVASSGPVTMVSRTYERSSWWQVTTRDATEAGGSAPKCAWHVYTALHAAFEMLKTQEGRVKLSKLLGACKTISGDMKHMRYLVAMWVQSAFGAMAMGNYPMKLNFIFGTYDKPAPAWPVRVACEHLRHTPANNDTAVANLAAAMAVLYNVTENVQCNDLDVDYTDSGNWDYMVCTEYVPDSQPYFESKGWPYDMYYRQEKWTSEMMDAHCEKKYGIKPRWGWMNTTFGAGNVGGATNIVWANGLLDPWHSGGILNNVSDTVRAYIIPEGAHHLDLLFTSPHDPASVAFVRSEEMRHVKMWLDALKSSGKR